MPSATIRALLSPTEDQEKVKQAVLNMFPGADISIEPAERDMAGNPTGKKGQITGNILEGDLDHFARLLKDQKIRDSARGVLFGGKRGHHLHFALNRQAALMGRVSFGIRDVPLGNIEVDIDCDEPVALIESLAPDTRPVKKQKTGGSRLPPLDKTKELPSADEDWNEELDWGPESG